MEVDNGTIGEPCAADWPHRVDCILGTSSVHLRRSRLRRRPLLRCRGYYGGYGYHDYRYGYERPYGYGYDRPYGYRCRYHRGDGGDDYGYYHRCECDDD